jgi:hypothetical protein
MVLVINPARIWWFSLSILPGSDRPSTAMDPLVSRAMGLPQSLRRSCLSIRLRKSPQSLLDRMRYRWNCGLRAMDPSEQTPVLHTGSLRAAGGPLGESDSASLPVAMIQTTR